MSCNVKFHLYTKHARLDCHVPLWATRSGGGSTLQGVGFVSKLPGRVGNRQVGARSQVPFTYLKPGGDERTKFPQIDLKRVFFTPVSHRRLGRSLSCALSSSWVVNASESINPRLPVREAYGPTGNWQPPAKF